MRLRVTRASSDTYETAWDCETIQDLLDKIKECGCEVIIDEDGDLTIYDDYVE